MRTVQRVTLVFVGLAVFALVAGAPAFASQAEQPKQQPAPIRGELVKVDTDAKTLTLKVADGTEMTFQYDDNTEIQGAKDAAGLATMQEGRLTVHFKEDAKTKNKLATRIIVEPKK